MKRIFTIIVFAFITNQVVGQNSFQRNLYDLNDEIIVMQKRINQSIDEKTLNDEFELTKSLNRLSEEATSEMIKNNLDRELSELINFACELGKQKLDFLIAYKRYKNDFYLKKFNDIDKIYLSIYLKVKAKE